MAYTSKVLAFALGMAVVLAFAGALFYVGSLKAFGASPTGSMFNDGKVAAVSWAPATSAASSTSILNTDGNTRIITDSFLACTGANGQGFTMTAATTSVPNLGLQGSTFLAASDVATTTTVSTTMFVASSTEGVPAYTSRLWPANTYLTFDASAVNAGNCTAGVHYLGT